MMQCGLAVKGLILTKTEVKVALSFVRGSLTWHCEGTGFRGESGIGRGFFFSHQECLCNTVITTLLSQ